MQRGMLVRPHHQQWPILLATFSKCSFGRLTYTPKSEAQRITLFCSFCWYAILLRNTRNKCQTNPSVFPNLDDLILSSPRMISWPAICHSNHLQLSFLVLEKGVQSL